jgi:hypothetical protein
VHNLLHEKSTSFFLHCVTLSSKFDFLPFSITTMFLIFDTETTGLPLNYNAPIEDLNNWPRVVQISWQLHELNGQLVEHKNFIIKSEGY